MQGRIGLDASNYINSVERMTDVLRNFTNVSANADKAMQQMGGAKNPFEQIAQDAAVSLRKIDELRKGVALLQQQGMKQDWKDVFNFRLDKERNELEHMNTFLGQMGLTLAEVEEATKGASDAWAKFGIGVDNIGKRVEQRQRIMFEAIQQDFRGYKDSVYSNLQSVEQRFPAYISKLKTFAKNASDITEKIDTKVASVDISKEKALDIASKYGKAKQERRVQLGKQLVEAQMETVQAREGIDSLIAEAEKAAKEGTGEAQGVIAKEIQRFLKKEVGQSFDAAGLDIRTQSVHLREKLRDALQKSAGLETSGKIIKGLRSDDPEKRAEYEMKYAEAALALRNLEVAKQVEQNRLEQERVTSLREQLRSKELMVSKDKLPVADLSKIENANAQLRSMQALHNVIVESVKIGPTTTYEDLEKQRQVILDMLNTEEGRSQLAKEQPQILKAYIDVLREEKQIVEDTARIERERLQASTSRQLNTKDLLNTDVWRNRLMGKAIERPRTLSEEGQREFQIAEQQFALSRAAAIGQEQAARREALDSLAKEYATLSANDRRKYTPEHLAQAAIGPETPENKSARQFMLDNMLTSYKKLLELVVTRDRLEKQVTQSMKAQTQAAETNVYNSKINVKRNETALQDQGALGNLMKIFQEKYDRNLIGFGKVEAMVQGQQVIKAYAATDLKPEDFVNNINAIYQGNEKLITQYPELVRGLGRFNTSIQHGESETKKLVAHWDNFYRLILARGITWAFYNITRQIETAVRTSVELYQALAEIQTISQGSSMTIDDWAESVRQLSDTYHIAQQDIAESLYQVTSNQIAVAQGAVSFVSAVAPFAKATKSTMTDAVNILSSAINSYNINTVYADVIAAQFFRTVELGRVRINEMADSLGRVISLASVMGVRLSEVNAMTAMLTISGVKYERASTYILNVLNAMIKPSEKMKGFFEYIGASSGEAAIAMYGMAGTMAKLLEYTRGQAGEMGEIYRNQRAIIGVSMLTQDTSKLEEVTKKISESMKYYQEAQKYIFEGPGEKIIDLANRAKNIFIDTAQTFVKTLVVGTDELLKDLSGTAFGQGNELGLSNLSALLPGVLASGSLAFGGKTLSTVFENPTTAKMLKSGGVKAAVIFFAAFTAYAIREMRYSQLLNPDRYYKDNAEKRQQLLEESYNKEEAEILKLREELERTYDGQLKDLREHLQNSEYEWARYYSKIEDYFKAMQGLAKLTESSFDKMIKRQQGMYVGGAVNVAQEGFARLQVGGNILSYVDKFKDQETRTDLLTRFMAYSEETLSTLDSNIREIEKAQFEGKPSENLPFYNALQFQRAQLEDTMGQVLQQISKEAGIELTGDPFIDMYKAQEIANSKWDKFLEDFKELKTFLEKQLGEGTVTAEALEANIRAGLATPFEQMFKQLFASDPTFKAWQEQAAQRAAIENKLTDERAKLTERQRSIGLGDTGAFMSSRGAFSQIVAAANVLKDVQPGFFQEVTAIQEQYEKWGGIIPADELTTFNLRLADVIKTGNEIVKQNESFLDSWSGFLLNRAQQRAYEQLRTVTGGASDIPKILGINPEANFKATGGHIGGPRGTDTVPAWLTPGEFVIRREMAQKHAPLLEKINNGYLFDGGYLANTNFGYYGPHPLGPMHGPHPLGYPYAPHFVNPVQMQELYLLGLRRQQIAQARIERRQRDLEKYRHLSFVSPSIMVEPTQIIDPLKVGLNTRIAKFEEWFSKQQVKQQQLSELGPVMKFMSKLIDFSNLSITDSDIMSVGILKSLLNKILVGGTYIYTERINPFRSSDMGNASLQQRTIGEPYKQGLGWHMKDGGWVGQTRTNFQSGGKVYGSTVNNYSTNANITLQTSGNEAYDARRLLDNIKKETHRGTRRLVNAS